MRFRKLYNPETLKYRVEFWISWRCIPLTGFWFLPQSIKEYDRALHRISRES